MLETTATPAKNVQVIVFFERQKAPETASLLDDLPQFPGCLLSVERADVADIDQEMLAAIDFELMDDRFSGNDGRINQGVVIRG